MNGQPLHPQAGQEGDILDQAIDKNPAGDTPAKPASTAKDARNKRSSVYIYLVVLFGAAFLMLLLAYFIQQRNNESTISSLRDSMNLSREELLDEIEALEKDKETLEDLVQSLRPEITRQEEEIKRLEEETEISSQALLRSHGEKNLINILGWLERFCAEGDYLMAAAVVEADDSLFNVRSVDYDRRSLELDPTPIQAARYLELREAVFDRAGCMVIEEYSTTEDGGDYTERPYIEPSASRFSEETVSAARSLWAIFSSYSDQQYGAAADQIAAFCAQDGNLERLDSRAFKASTAELFEQIVDDLIGQRLLVENEDGGISLREVHSMGGAGESVPPDDVSRETSGE